LYISRRDLEIERAQCKDEGKNIARLEAEFTDLLAPDLAADTVTFQTRAGKLLDDTARLRQKAGSAHHEPNDLAGIRRARGKCPALPPVSLDPAALRDKALGAWLGRAAGCLLGKPVEGRRRAQIAQYLKSQSRWPLNAYFSNRADEAVRLECKFPAPADPCYLENITCMVEDDDTNYTTVGLALMEKRGRNFTPADMASFWLENIPILHTCTAERVAYRNLVTLVPPPDPDGAVSGRFSSATYRNPYREWIGAQIRADFFGYVSPGLPEQAAEYAWRDACISHVKNGIYGEMWVAAMLAAAYGISDDPAAVIRAGLAQIPRRCRLQADLNEVLTWHAEGIGYEAAVDRLHARWNEADGHHWCHTNSNAQVVAIALLWGELDFTRTVGYAVMPGFDTDCNGATAGSVLGLMLGGKRIPAQWADPLKDTLLTGVAGYHKVSLTHMADKTVELIGKT
jgi:ADP-ribosylglycohydrolase